MTAATARRRASEPGPVEPRSGPRFGVRQLGRGRLASWPALRLSGGRIGRFVLVIERRGFEAPPHRQLRPDPRTPGLRGPQAGNGSTAPIAVEPGTPGAPRHVPSHVDESQRLPMYIVISKPKRISVNSGLVHMFPSSGTMGCIGSSRRCHMYRRPLEKQLPCHFGLVGSRTGCGPIIQRIGGAKGHARPRLSDTLSAK